ncbi:hypothetical protein [Enterococcus sp. CWB-B31]|uniref:hypothetical protein n=1 Tax=Enterococcus sp. CWB-B31 TaxID=2885159 RepID=UPI001E5708C2|nr:hypothetical protein [Enterococcus sp. CWB-B31]MCB5954999.1 hypothetical protein [Enterococcus sp. CWB-B31]
MKTILVAAGTSDNKRNFAVTFIQNYLNEQDVEAAVTGKSIYKVSELDLEVSAIVVIGQPNFQTDVPVIDGTAFITKFGMETCCEQIINAL